MFGILIEKEETKMPAFVETMAYNVAKKPWHGLGNAVDPSMNIEQWQSAAGLDWTVSRRLVRMKINREENGDMAIPGYVAIVRDSDNQVFQVASDRYHPIQNKEVLQFFREYTEAGGMQIETAGALKKGAVTWALAKIGSEFTLAGGDKVDGYLLLANSHDGSLAFNAMFTSVRVVCWNTLSAALYQEDGKKQPNMFRMKHSKKFTAQVAQDAKIKLGLAQKQMKALGEASHKLSESKVDFYGNVVKEYILKLTNPGLLDDAMKLTEIESTTERKSFLEAAIERTGLSARFDCKRITEEDLGRVGRGILESIWHSPGSQLASAKNTYWGVVNGVTHYADHEAGRERDTALQSAWFGQKATLKTAGLELAMQYAGKGVN